MARLNVPSLQHLARNWSDDPLRVKHVLVDLALNSPTFNYNPLFGVVQDMLIFRQPYDQLVKGIERGVRRQDVRENFLTVLPMIKDHFDGVDPTYVQSVGRRYYPAGRGLMVPFDPPLIYGLGGRIHFPWFSFWRRNPIASVRLSLFVTMVGDVLSQDPDLEDAEFSILDFSAPSAKESRALTVIDAREVLRLSEIEKKAMLEVFAEGYFLAQVELSNIAHEEGRREEAPEPKPNDGQQSLFD